MCQQENDPVQAERAETDAFDEFEDGVRRIGLFMSGVWADLKLSEKVGHAISLLTLAALIFYTAYTIKIYKASNRSAEAAETSNTRAHIEFIQDQRPFLELILQGTAQERNPDNALTYVESTGKLWQKFQLKNYGKSPAIHITVQSDMTIGKDALEEMRVYKFEPQPLKGTVLAPQDVFFNETVYRHTIDLKTFDSVSSFNGGIVVFGHVEYAGLYSNPADPPYVTEFCFYYTRVKGTVKACEDEIHNWIR